MLLYLLRGARIRSTLENTIMVYSTHWNYQVNDCKIHSDFRREQANGCICHVTKAVRRFPHSRQNIMFHRTIQFGCVVCTIRPTSSPSYIDMIPLAVDCEDVSRMWRAGTGAAAKHVISDFTSRSYRRVTNTGVK
jgi:hypothetical protein